MTRRRKFAGQQREVRRFWACARKLSRENGVPLAKAARAVRQTLRLVRDLDRGELTFGAMVREIRTLARAVRP